MWWTTETRWGYNHPLATTHLGSKPQTWVNFSLSTTLKLMNTTLVSNWKIKLEHSIKSGETVQGVHTTLMILKIYYLDYTKETKSITTTKGIVKLTLSKTCE